ncbi:MAG: 4Fe-4S dicluster domain-containing protein [Calditrichaeota bacterium]|nr:4Fe-4S dicluster domain-containing protein [Calditrichota bacterium]
MMTPVQTLPTIPDESGSRGINKSYWRSSGELIGDPVFIEQLHREFPEAASELTDPVSRRTFLGLMGASMALAALTGCRRPLETIVPYVKAPEDIVLGRPERYATAMQIAGDTLGLLVTTREGRPVKIDGNALHPSSGGGSSIWAQAAILDLYDPDRSRHIKERGQTRDRSEFVEFLRRLRSEYLARQGEGLAVLSEAYDAPTMARLQSEFRQVFPRARWIVREAVGSASLQSALEVSSGMPCRVRYDYGAADVTLALDADIFGTEPGAVSAARGFARRRNPDSEQKMNRLYVAESNFTLTGANADHRFRIRSSEIAKFTLALAKELNATGGLGLDGMINGLPEGDMTASGRVWLKALAGDLLACRGRSILVAGRHQPASVQALVIALNEALGNRGATVIYSPLPESARIDHSGEQHLASDIAAGSVTGLILLGGNPVYDGGAGVDWKALLNKVPQSLRLGYWEDETSAACRWHLPQAHTLEAWGDAFDASGAPSLAQPQIEPMFGGWSGIELIGFLLTGSEARGYELVRETWRGFLPGVDYESQWRKTLHDGAPAGGGQVLSSVLNVSALTGFIASHWPKTASGIEAVFRPSPALFDGRFANNGWLQELPDPMTKLTWDNAALVSPKSAVQWSLKTGDVVRLELSDAFVEAPVLVLPGHSDDSVTLPLGYGREFGRIAAGVGFNVYRLKPASTSEEGDVAGGLKVVPTGRRSSLATTQEHWSMEGRPIVREASLGEYRENPDFAHDMVPRGAEPSLWKEWQYDQGYQWGMAIDLNSCTGCNVCTIACQSENNIPIVGREQVKRSREMHWIRLDRYFTGPVEDPQSVAQPVGCQHCEMAPCEQVCPVAATNHDAEGLNVMTYNRCVGTRYCSNNCPYKARRFNFFNYTNKLDSLVQMVQNPDVTVRSRGVMEKCTYCIQRINRAKHEAKLEGDRPLRDGDVLPACAEACPAGAIVFGNILDPNSRVSQLKRDARNYELLADINTRPRTSYLARVRNPNPALG